MTDPSENCSHNATLQTRVTLEQLAVDGYKPITFASRFPYSCVERYSVGVLEPLGVVWLIEHIKTTCKCKKLKLNRDQSTTFNSLKSSFPFSLKNFLFQLIYALCPICLKLRRRPASQAM